MAINVKEILANALLELCVNTLLNDLTIKQLLEYSGVSRQTFYNHFKDKNDLIQYIYLTRIIPDYHYHDREQLDFKKSLIISFENMKRYHYFMKQACMMEGQNCLKDYIFEHCKAFDLKWHQELYGQKVMPDTLRFATEYHATASSSMTLAWILSDMPVSCEKIATMIVQMRGIGMKELFKDGEFKETPYVSD